MTMNSPLLPNHTPYSLEDILGAAMPREKALAMLQTNSEAFHTFQEMPSKEQERILAFIQGNQGLRILHNNFFLHVMNPIIHPQRLEHLISAILGQNIHIRAVIPREGSQLVDSGSFVIMDILVELSDGTILNVEIQRIGYAFPGERSNCYISDLIMRQYNRVKSERGKKFSYRDLKPVFLIILMEESSFAFSAVAPHYIHREQVTYDSGAKVTNLTKIIYISLDTFHSVVQNITTELDAWLTFLSSDHPADIVKLVNAYPEFLEYYKDIMEFRRNPKELIYMYSEALAIMDRNTEEYMYEQMLEQKKFEIEQKKLEIEQKKHEIEQTKLDLAQTKHEIEQTKLDLAQTKREIEQTKLEIEQLKAACMTKENENIAIQAEKESLQVSLDAALARIKELENKQ